MQSIEIELLGRKYFFKTDNPDKIREYAEFMKKELDSLYERNPAIDHTKLFAYYSLSLTERFFDEIAKNKELSEELKNIDSSLKDLNSDININIWNIPCDMRDIMSVSEPIIE